MVSGQRGTVAYILSPLGKQSVVRLMQIERTVLFVKTWRWLRRQQSSDGILKYANEIN